jgi:UV DNA damage endonuclease
MSSINKPIQLGLCCINTILRAQKPPVYSSRRMIIKSIEEKGIDELKSKILENLRDVIKIMDWNEANGIKLYRMSSEMFPHKSNNKVQDYDFDFAKDLLREIGEKSRLYNQRLTFHPGQYNVVGSPSEKSFKQTINDLSYHADVMDLMGLDNNSVMVVHGGGIYGNKEETIERWCDQFYLLPENVRRRLVLENCEKCYSIEDCLNISERINIPVVFDTHHFECYKLLHPTEHFEEASFYMERILRTWNDRGIKPKFHVSEQGNGRCGHHSDYIEIIPEYLLEIPEKYGVNIDIMIEAKMKEQAILRLYSKYPFLNCIIKDKEKEKEQINGDIKRKYHNYKSDMKVKKKKKHKKYKLILID